MHGRKKFVRSQNKRDTLFGLIFAGLIFAKLIFAGLIFAILGKIAKNSPAKMFQNEAIAKISPAKK